MVQNNSVVGTYIITIEIQVEKSASKELAKIIQNRISTIQGVSKVDLFATNYIDTLFTTTFIDKGVKNE